MKYHCVCLCIAILVLSFPLQAKRWRDDVERKDASSFPVEVYAGLETSTGQLVYGFSDELDDVYQEEFWQGGVGLFLDLHYLRVGATYLSTLGKGESNSTVTRLDAQEIETSYSFTELYAVAKYPFAIFDTCFLWPAFGFSHTFLIEAKDGDGDTIDDLDISDSYLLCGAGVDVKLSDTLLFTSSILYGLNLSAPSAKNPDADYEHYGNTINLRLGCGLRI